MGRRKNQETKRVYSHKYANAFLSLKCAPDMLTLGLFPNFKEITESMAAFDAIMRHFYFLDPGDSKVHIGVVGDGAMPRTAAMFAFRTRWTAHCVDPLLRTDRTRLMRIRRVELYRARIQDVSLPKVKLWVAVHGHGPLEGLNGAGVAIPCCFEQKLTGREPDLKYQDNGIWSPENQVHVWLH